MVYDISTSKKEVHVDEFEIGTPQKVEQGRSKSEKKSKSSNCV
jgi:hypothetical protein